MTSKRYRHSKIGILLMIVGVNLSILIVASMTFIGPKGTRDLASILLSGWRMSEDVDSVSESAFLRSVRIDSLSRCSIPSSTDKDGRRLQTSEIRPSISVRFTKPIEKQVAMKLASQYEDCISELAARPMIAKSCINTLPVITNEDYSVYIERHDCNGETLALYNALLANFR